MAEKDTQKKWLMLAEKIVKRGGSKREYNFEQLQSEFLAFVDYYSNHPSTYYLRTKHKRKGADKKTADIEMSGDRIERVAPMTEHAFCTWLGKSRSWFPQTIADLKKRGDERSEEDNKILEFMIELQTFFSSQLLEGAILGEYSQPLVASLLGMRNQIDVTSGGKSAAPIISIVEDKKTRDDYDAKNETTGTTDADKVDEQ